MAKPPSRFLIASALATSLALAPAAATLAQVAIDDAELDSGPEPCTEEIALERSPVPVRQALDDADCVSELERSNVQMSRVSHEVDGVGIPTYLVGDLAGVNFVPRNHQQSQAVVDCRLAVALLAWAQRLRSAGVVRVEYVSAYRPGARVARSGRPSGHAKGFALDIARFELEDGTSLDVLGDWRGARGEPPCAPRDEPARASRLRAPVCAAVETERFQIVLTPHFDRAHRDHVHLELRPDVEWTFLR